MANSDLLSAEIGWLSLDVDGVLTDGRLYYGLKGEEIKVFHARDGFAIKLWQQAGGDLLIVSGRHSDLVQRRAEELGIQHVYTGVEDKFKLVQEFCHQNRVRLSHVCHIGDDLPDLRLLKEVGLGICVSDGHPVLKAHADLVTTTRGGEGVLSEVVEKILTAQGLWDKLIQEMLKR